MTPDSFFQINRNLKPGVIARDDGSDQYRVYKPKEPPNTTKDFKEILEKPDEKTNDKAKTIPEEKDSTTLINPMTTKEKKVETFIDLTTKPLNEIDPRFNQITSMAKDSKLSPKLGTELAVAPGEEPRAQPYVEPKVEEVTTVVKATQELPIAVPLDKVIMKTPANITIEKPNNSIAAESKTTKSLSDNENENLASENKTVVIAPPTDTTVNPITPQSATIGQTTRVPERIQQIIDMIAGQVTLVENKGQTDTTITVNLPGTFQGAIITVSSFKHAPGEFNITFENLTQEAKILLDLPLNRSLLKEGLDQKGFVVHMITTTTIVERSSISEAYTSNRDGRGDGRQGGFGQRQKEKEEEKG